jgi:CRISPR system Cascade subunit CasC
MKLIEIHIAQSFPATCLNRDDLGSPKSMTLGGVSRARISSQCLKRAIRLTARDYAPELFKGKRTRLIVDPIIQRLLQAGIDETVASAAAKAITNELATTDEKAEGNGGGNKVKTAFFISNAELDSIAGVLAEKISGDAALAAELVKLSEVKEQSAENDAKTDEKKKVNGNGKEKVSKAVKALSKLASTAIKGVQLADAADIALFGRMAASDHSLTVEGAASFGHAVSTHKCVNDLDFFAAVDDLQDKNESGAAITSVQEFNSATYYRYAALNINLLKENLPTLTTEELRRVADSFIRAVLVSVPSARRNSMNGATLPSYVLGIAKLAGQQLQLVDAFEKPISSRNGLVEGSVAALKAHHESLKSTWGIATAVEVAIPDVNVNEFIKRLLDGVFGE